MLDAGTGIRALGYALAAEAAGEPMTIHVVLSHFHWDHLQGLPFFAPLFSPGHDVRFYAVTDDGRLDRLLHGQMCFPYFPVPFDDLAASTRTVSVREGESVRGRPDDGPPVPGQPPAGRARLPHRVRRRDARLRDRLRARRARLRRRPARGRPRRGRAHLGRAVHAGRVPPPRGLGPHDVGEGRRSWRATRASGGCSSSTTTPRTTTPRWRGSATAPARCSPTTDLACEGDEVRL